MKIKQYFYLVYPQPQNNMLNLSNQQNQFEFIINIKIFCDNDYHS